MSIMLHSKKTTINCGGKLLDLSRPLVMGILNLTSDSFFKGSRFPAEEQWESQVRRMLDQGAAIIDIGAVSTRPGSHGIGPKEECRKLKPALKKLTGAFPDIIFSIDTYHAAVAEFAVDNGASIINDISGGTMDTDMFTTIARLRVPYVLMHIQGSPETMQSEPHYDNIIKEISFYFSDRLSRLRDLGVCDIILDPGFGFGKTVEHNYTLLNNLEYFQFFDLPLLAGLSRKSMINRTLGITPDDALNGTSVLNTIALLKGVDILRVHDVKEAVEAVKLVDMMSATVNPM